MIYAAGAFVALLLLAAFHYVAQMEGANQWERAAYIVWAGQCDRAEVLCKRTALQFIENHY